jgi:hypothetical protein
MINKEMNFFILPPKLSIYVIINMILFCGLERVPIINPPFADNSPLYNFRLKRPYLNICTSIMANSILYVIV